MGRGRGGEGRVFLAKGLFIALLQRVRMSTGGGGGELFAKKNFLS